MRTLTPPRPDAPVAPAEAAARPEWSWRREAAIALATAVAALAILVPVLQLWRAAWDVPFRYQGDATYHLSVAKGLIDFGGSSTNPALGAPFGQVIHDMPLGGDRLHLVLLRVLGMLTGDPAATVNLFFVLSFPLVAVAAVLALRRLRVSAAPAVVGALLYAFLPYHFARGENHLFLSGYYTVPIAVYLAIRLLDGRAVEARSRRRTLWWMAGCVLVGSGGAYYAPFSAMLVAVAAMAAYARTRSLPLLRAGGLTLGLILGTFAVNLAPSLWYVHQHGANTAGAVGRHPAESEVYGLKLTGMLLPREDHRLGGFANLEANFRKPSPVPSEAGQALGLVTAAGLCYLLGLAALTLAGRRRFSDSDRHLSLLAVSTVLIGTVGGVSSLIALLISPQIRSWNRLSIYIGFLALVALGGLADRFRTHLRARGSRPVTWGVVLGVVLAIGLLDQTSGADVPRYATLAAQYHSDGAFVGAVEAALPDQAMVFQLPIRAFPELRGPVDMKVSDPFRPYLQSHHLRWSFGGVEGRPTADWQTPLAAQPAESLLPRLAALDFAGLVVDRFGYDDRAAALETTLRAELGAPARVSPDGRFSFFDLRPYASRQAGTLGADAKKQLAGLTLNPTQVSWTGVDGIGSDPLDRVGTAQRSFTVAFANPDDHSRPVRFRLSIEGSPTSPPLRVDLPDGSRIEVPLPDGRAVIDRILDVPSGRSEATFTTDGFPISEIAATQAERYNLRLSDPAIYDVAPVPTAHAS
jgi:hypothetical protein